MIFRVGWCPNKRVPFGYWSGDLGANVCPKCSQPLIPDHLTKEEWEQNMVQDVEVALDGDLS